MNDFSIGTLECFESDRHFDSLYPKYIQELSAKHWTPLKIAGIAAGYLAEQPNSRILDIGSGVGKFCIAAGSYYRDCHFYGVEQRGQLIDLAENAKEIAETANVSFIHGNFTQLDLDQYDHFYFYNSFYENLVDDDLHIDESIDHSVDLYEEYTDHLYRVLEQRPVGTRLTTYHNYREVVADSYYLVGTYNNLLRFWVKR